MNANVAVIGGGWAGCTAALALAEAGVAVTLYEAGRVLGGRARAVQLENEPLDNGQHILLGAYSQTLQLIERLNPIAAPEGLWRLPLTLNQPPDFSLTCPRLPAPLHLLVALLGAKGLSWGEKLTAARWAHGLLNSTHCATDDLRVAQLTSGQPEKLNRLLWHPLCVSALNTPPETASARVFRDVIGAAFGGRNQHSDLLLPRRDLTTLLPAPAAARITELGGTVRPNCRVTAVEANARTVVLDTRDGKTAYSHVIIAVAPQHLAGLAAPIHELAPMLRGVAAYRYHPIATGYVQYDPAFRLSKPLFALTAGPAQFVFDRGQSHAQAGLVAFVASAAEKLPADWLDLAEAQLRRFADMGRPRWRRRIVEKQATYACVPGMTRPGVRTAHARILLAGDYIAGPYPATLESATRSGVQSAGALLEQL